MLEVFKKRPEGHSFVPPASRRTYCLQPLNVKSPTYLDMLYYVPSVNYPQPIQKYLFIILLLILSCDEALGPEDCAGIPGGDAMEDECGECGGDGSSCSSTVCEDIDDNVYETVQIGRIWC